MSRYSGKCDVADMYDDYTDEQLQNTDFYIGRNIVPLRIESQKDLAPYYPHLVCVSSRGNSRETCVITTDSFIDREEAEHLSWRLESLKKYRRKCKREKKIYNIDEAIKASIIFHETASGVDREMARRVGVDGDKATIDGLHDGLHEYYRNELFDEMVRLGWPEDKADYWIWRDVNRLYKKEENECIE